MLQKGRGRQRIDAFLVKYEKFNLSIAYAFDNYRGVIHDRTDYPRNPTDDTQEDLVHHEDEQGLKTMRFYLKRNAKFFVQMRV